MKIQKRLAAQVMDVSPKRVKFDNQRLADIKEAITKTDIRQLVAEKAIKKVQEKGVSRGRARKIKVQKSKGLRKGPGSRQGKATSRLPRKESWMNKIRSQRKFIAELKEKELITLKTYRNIYLKCKGGFFRSTRHIKIFLEDHKLFEKKDQVKTEETVKPAKKTTSKKPDSKKEKTTKKWWFMSSKTKYTVRYRRQREGRTDYKKRLNLLKGKTDRLIIRKTNTKIILQIARYEPDGDKVLVTVNSSELKKLGWTHSCKNISAAYLAGLLLAKRAKEKQIEKAILDLGLISPFKGSKLFSALKGVIEGGLDVPANEEIFPTEERLKGDHVASHLEKHKSIAQNFDKIKKKIKEW